MTDKTDPIEQDVAAEAGGDQQVSVEALQSRIAELEKEAAKHRNIRKSVERERDEFKAKAKTSSEEDYKSLYQEQLSRNDKYREGRKSAEVESALVAQLTKAGVSKEALKAAAKLADKALIEWDEDNGVEDVSVTAAVQKLKATEGWMFESKVAKTEPKNPADGTSHNANEIKRSDFDRLDPMARMNAVKKGMRIVD